MTLRKHREEIIFTQNPLPSVFAQLSTIRAEFGLQKKSSCICWRKLTDWFGEPTGQFVRQVADRLRVSKNGLFIYFCYELNIPGVCTGSSWYGVNFLHRSLFHAVVWFLKVTFHPLPLPHPLSQK